LAEKERGIRFGPVKIGIGKKKEVKRPSPIEIQGKLTYAMKRLEKKAQMAEAKAKQKRELAKEALRQGREERARQRLISAQLQLSIAQQALRNADFAEGMLAKMERAQDLRDLQDIINELGSALSGWIPEEMIGNIEESAAKLQEASARIAIAGEKMGTMLEAVTTSEIPEAEIEEEMAKLIEEVQAEAAEELKPIEIEERVKAVREAREKESKAE
jgi:DNA replication protein DnaD